MLACATFIALFSWPPPLARAGLARPAGSSTAVTPSSVPAARPPSAAGGAPEAALATQARLAHAGSDGRSGYAALLPEGDDAWRNLDAGLSSDYPLHGVAFHWLAQVFSAPSEGATVVGYLRRGATLRAREGERGNGCDTLWHAVFGGGYVCAGRGFLLGDTPQGFPSAAPPLLYDPLPYRYAKAQQADTPVFFRAPTKLEERELGAKLSQARGQNTLPQLASQARPVVPAGRGVALPKSPLPPPVVLPEVVRMLLQPGFYISLDRREPSDESGFLRTVRGDFVRDSGERSVVPGSLRGVALSGERSGPLALITRAKVASYTRDALSGELVRSGEFSPLEAVEPAGELIRSGKRSYAVLRDGRIVQDDALRLLPAIERPAIVPKHARWIAISLSTQALIAFDGETPVYATLVSSGKPEHETPTGLFRIASKHVSATMDGEAGNDEAYSIEDVPWVMYFSGSIALHGAFWHERFGRTRSHGCVNLAPLDARWLFDWTEPALPYGFHGVEASAERPGTIVAVLP
jgi:L,D-transpeptidase catalytic domain